MTLTPCRHYISHFALVCLLLLSAGCALSPQEIEIRPDIDVAGSKGGPQSVRLDVVDDRSSSIIGQRGGIYKETSHISTSANMTRTLRNSVDKAMQKQGYTIVDGAADATLVVHVSDMYYIVHREKLLYNIEIHVNVRSIINKGGREFTGDYKATRKKEYVKVPSIDENEKLVNEAFALVLGKMLSDDDFNGFIRE